MKNQDFYRFFKNIKQLCVVSNREQFFRNKFIEFVHRHPHLEHLQMNILQNYHAGNEFKIRLNLPNLKSLCYNEREYRQTIDLNCPQLERLSLCCDFLVDEKCASFADSLKFLRVESFQCKLGFALTSLEVLVSQEVLSIDLRSHKNLKEIHFKEQLRFWYKSDVFFYIPRAEEEVVNELFHQKQSLKRRDLKIYCAGIRAIPGIPGPIFEGLYSPYLNSYLDILFRNSADFKLEHQKKKLIYQRGFDKEIATLEAEQCERLARCLVEVILKENLGNELNAKFKILFRYVQKLSLDRDIPKFGQSDLDRLPDLFPHLLELNQGISPDKLCNRSFHSNDLADHTLNFRFLSRFKCLQKFRAEHWWVSSNELKEMVENCRFLRKFETCFSIFGEQTTVKLSYTKYRIRIDVNDKKIEVRIKAFKREYSIKHPKTLFQPIHQYPWAKNYYQPYYLPDYKYFWSNNFYCWRKVWEILDEQGYLRGRVGNAYW